LGLEYTGVGNFSGVVGAFGYRVRSRARTARFALLARLRGLAALLLQVRRFERIEHKIDLLEQQFGARADRISAKSDEGVWVISEKLDAYGLELKQQHAVLRDALAKNQRLLGEVSRIGRLSEEVQQLCHEMQRLSGEMQRLSGEIQRQSGDVQ